MVHQLCWCASTLRTIWFSGAPVPTTKFAMDSKSTTFVAQAETGPKKSAWIQRRIGVLQDGVISYDIRPIHISEADMIADGCTKYVTAAVFFRHFYYILNKGAEYPAAKSVKFIKSPQADDWTKAVKAKVTEMEASGAWSKVDKAKIAEMEASGAVNMVCTVSQVPDTRPFQPCEMCGDLNHTLAMFYCKVCGLGPYCANPSEPRTCIKMHELKCEPEINKYPYLPGNRWVCTICNERSTAVKPERDPYFMECPTCCQMFCIDCYEFTHTCEPELP